MQVGPRFGVITNYFTDKGINTENPNYQTAVNSVALRNSFESTQKHNLLQASTPIRHYEGNVDVKGRDGNTYTVPYDAYVFQGETGSKARPEMYVYSKVGEHLPDSAYAWDKHKPGLNPSSGEYEEKLPEHKSSTTDYVRNSGYYKAFELKDANDQPVREGELLKDMKQAYEETFIRDRIPKQA